MNNQSNKKEQSEAAADQAVSWWVARSATRREAAARASLMEIGLTVYMPVERSWRSPFRGTTRMVMERPLFPGYLFVLAREADLGRVWAADGVHAVVCIETPAGPRPMHVPQGHMLAIQSEEAEGLYDRTRAVRQEYRPRKGAGVKIIAGPWMGFMARVLATPRGQRAQVMVEGPFGSGTIVDIKYLRPR